ncbi:MAG: hypothetical protein WBD20_03390 [Pirellulaceae bacterium]
MNFRFAPRSTLGILAAVCAFVDIDCAVAADPCCIRIVDAQNDWPLPLVELESTHHVRLVSDNNGLIAFDVPELMNVESWFHVKGHGYGVPADGFGYRGVKLTPRPGETLTVKVQRQLPAKRLGRITGGGLFAESQKLGLELDWQEQKILGCDSVQNCIHNGQLFWGWGDTTLPGYPLGRFHMIGAVTPVQPLESFEPPVRLQYEYFVDAKKVPRNVAQLPGDGPTWLSGYASLEDKDGLNHLVATYSKIKPPLEEYELGLCVWNAMSNRFDTHHVLWNQTQGSPKPSVPRGHAVNWTDDKGKSWLLFGDPFPALKCPATFEGWQNPATWKTIKRQLSVRSKGGQDEVKPHRGAIAWNDYRKKWVTVFTQFGGKSSQLGEIWYAEADQPTGPWQDAIHVVTHDQYSFYNPQLHPEFTVAGSPILLFEATYTKTFSKTMAPTPRHDYNQILYRLDLDELSE